MENEIIRNCGTCRFAKQALSHLGSDLVLKPLCCTQEQNKQFSEWVGDLLKENTDYCQLWMYKPNDIK